MTLPKLRIESKGRVGYGTHVYLNDFEVPGLEAITLTMRVDDVAQCDLTIAVDTVDVDAETMLQLQALVDAKEMA